MEKQVRNIGAGDFVHLHVHSEYSLLDGACRIKEAAKYVKSLGQTALAITDHGSMCGVIDFYEECLREGVKPIIGCEVYVARRSRFDKVHKVDSSPYHLVLLCENNQGYQNLIQLVSKAYIEGFYNRPRVDLELLEQYHEGLIASSACLAGALPRQILAGDYRGAMEAALEYDRIFGRGNFFIELQNHSIPEQRQVLPVLKKISDDTGIPMIATNDAHYVRKEDAKMQRVLVCIQTNRTIDDTNGLEFATQEFYLKNSEEMRQLFEAYPGALENTVRIAERCNVSFEFGVTKLPRFTAPDGEDNLRYFTRIAKQGLEKKYGPNPPADIRERFDYELGVIAKMGYVDYFLIVQDYVNFARTHDIPVGPGRGSGAGSIVAYCVGITQIDPIRYNLLFERFLNPERVSMPDFDIDFCYEKRQQVIDYVVDKYGSDHVAQIITFGTMAARGSIRDVGRVLGMPYQTVDAVAKMVPMALNMTIERALKESKDLRELLQSDESVRELIETAQKLEGMPRHASTHAAGVVITRDAVSSYVPLQKNDEAIVTQFPFPTLEHLGLLKMDFLGLRNLTVISDSERAIRKKDPSFDVSAIPLDDKDVFEMLSKGLSNGVFQFESGGMKQVLSQLKPDGMEDLIAVISLYRPGPMDSIPLYIRNRHHPELVTYKHPLLEPILKVTYGCIVYQEQVMQICRSLAGYSYGRSDLVRRAMAKKKVDVMEKEREYFIYGKKAEDGSVECVGAVGNGVSPEIATQIFDEMSSFASYAFNKSHAAAYALLSYQTAYLKCHYPKEYMAALLTSVLDNTNKIIEYLNECAHIGIEVLPPDVNYSGEGFAVSGEQIRFGLLAVKNIGRSFIRNMVAEREANGRFLSLYDFCKRMYGKEMNKRTLEGLIKCGGLDSLGHTRRQMMFYYEKVMDAIEQDKRANLEGQMDLFGTPAAQEHAQFEMPSVEEYRYRDMLELEKESVGMYLSGHPLKDMQPLIERMRYTTISDAIAEDSVLKDGDTVTVVALIQSKKLHVTKSNTTMSFLTIEDMTGTMEALVFPAVYDRFRAMLTEGQALLLKGKLSVREEEDPKLLVDEVARPDATDAQTFLQGEDPVAPPEQGKLYLRLSSREEGKLQDIKRLTASAQGQAQLILCFTDLGKRFRPSWCAGVRADQELLYALQGVVGEENLAWKPVG